MSVSKTTTLIPAKAMQLNKWQREDTTWMLSLYGTAIGAGILFLPIDVGLGGIWPVIVMLVFAFPMTYFSHRALCRFVLSGSLTTHDVTTVAEEHFGRWIGKFLTFLYCFSIYPVLLMYCVALTNTVENFIVNQLNLVAWPRSLIAVTLVTSFMIIIRFGQDVIIKSVSILVYPFVAILVLLSFYLVPYWNCAILQYKSSNIDGNNFSSVLMTIWMVIPVMVFSFNHTSIISSFAIAQKQSYGKHAEHKSVWILKYSHILMVTTVIFFAVSCIFSLSPYDLALAKKQNITILSYLANHFKAPIINYIAPVLAFIAITKAFFGHYLGACEGINGLLFKFYIKERKLNPKNTQYLIDLFIFLSCWLTATINPSILRMIEILGGPIIAVLLYLMPMYAIHTIPVLQKYKHPWQSIFICIMGFIAISAIIHGYFC